MNHEASLARLLVTSGRLAEDIEIADVGCSGGIHVALRQLEPRLSGAAIDPLLHEVARLKASETNPCITYVAAFVVSDRAYLEREYSASNWFWRSTAIAALEPEYDLVGRLIGVVKE